MESIIKNPYTVYVLGGLLLVCVGYIAYSWWDGSSYKPAPTPKTQNPNPNPIPTEKGTELDLKPALVMFYGKGCGHCTKAMPAFDEAANLLQRDGFSVYKFEMSENPREFREAHVEGGVPCFRLYPVGYPSDQYIPYQGDRSSDSFLKFAHTGSTD